MHYLFMYFRMIGTMRDLAIGYYLSRIHSNYSVFVVLLASLPIKPLTIP